MVFQDGIQPAWVKLAVWARVAFSIAAEVSHSADIFCSKMIVGLYYLIQEIGIFPMSVANNFCDMPLPKYLDSKTVLIYRPHPVSMESLYVGCGDFNKVKLTCSFKYGITYLKLYKDQSQFYNDIKKYFT